MGPLAQVVGGAVASKVLDFAIDKIGQQIDSLINNAQETVREMLGEIVRDELAKLIQSHCGCGVVTTPPSFQLPPPPHSLPQPGGHCGPSPTPTPAPHPAPIVIHPQPTLPPQQNTTNNNINITINITVVQNAFNQAYGTPNGNSLGMSADEAARELTSRMTPMEAGNFDRAMNQLREEVQKMFMQILDRFAGSGTGKADGENSKPNNSGAPKTIEVNQDFFTALAQAFGDIMQKSAENVMGLSKEVTNAYENSSKEKKSVAKSSNGSDIDKTKELELSASNDELMKLQTQMSAETMRMNFMTTGLQAALKAVGDSINSLART